MKRIIALALAALLLACAAVSLAEETVQYIGDRYISYSEKYRQFVLHFSLLNASQQQVAASAKVEIRIENANGKTVYQADESIDESSFSTWDSDEYGQRFLASVPIFTDEITPGDTREGAVHFVVRLSNGYFFDNNTLAVHDLPLASEHGEEPHGVRKPEYSLSGITYDHQNVRGRLVHKDGTGYAGRLKVRVTFFITGNYYMATAADVEKDGSFEVEGVGPIEYITALAFDKEGDGTTFCAADLIVSD